MKFEPYDYQKRAIEKIMTLPSVGLFLEMGLGKSVITLTAAKRLIYDELAVTRVLVVAPLMVARDTWSRECEKWDHLKDLRVSKILGSAKQRQEAVAAEADIYVINRENVVWLVRNYRSSWKWDMLVIDELSSFKSSKSERFRALKRIRPMFRRIVGLTGTPNPNGLMDLWAEVYLLDGGERLERTIGAYRRKYFRPGRSNGYVVYNWIPIPGADRAIPEKIKDITVSMLSKDYLQLPDRINRIVPVTLTDEEQKVYKKLEKEHLLELDNETEVSAANAAAVMGKLLQLSGGAIYDDDGGVVEFHQEKIKALEEIIETSEEPVLVFYGYRHERSRILKAFEKYGPRELKTEDDIKDWNDGKIRVLIAHPASVGYGLNLQDGGHIIVWYSLPWSLDQYQQANARLYRQGQKRPVIVHHLLATGTVDEQVMEALQKKNTGQAELMHLLDERRKT
jgi:SNF2 family DNA or RNA helicase